MILAEGPGTHPGSLTGRAAAIAAAERGWAVFPCRQGGKAPAVRDDWEHRACADPEKVARYWPSDRHNIGIACGPSNLVVIDLDTHGELSADWRALPGVNDGKDVFAQVVEWSGMDWPYTYTTTTPSAGWHLYFTAPEGSTVRNSASMIGPQVDVRAAGGYVVAAGSVVDGKRYEVLYDQPAEPLPPWIARLLSPPEPARSPAVPTGRGTPPARLSGLLHTVQRAAEGTRNQCLYWAASRGADMVAEGSGEARDIAGQLLSAALSAGLPEAEARRTIASAMRRVAR